MTQFYDVRTSFIFWDDVWPPMYIRRNRHHAIAWRQMMNHYTGRTAYQVTYYFSSMVIS